MLGMMDSAEESVLRAIRIPDAGPPALAAAPSSANGSDFLSAAASCVAGDMPAASAVMVGTMVFCPCLAVDGDSASSCSARSDGGFADIGAHNEDVVCQLCELCDDNLRDGPDGTPIGTREVVICEGCQGGFHVACVRVLPSLRRRGKASVADLTRPR